MQWHKIIMTIMHNNKVMPHVKQRKIIADLGQSYRAYYKPHCIKINYLA